VVPTLCVKWYEQGELQKLLQSALCLMTIKTLICGPLLLSMQSSCTDTRERPRSWFVDARARTLYYSMVREPWEFSQICQY